MSHLADRNVSSYVLEIIGHHCFKQEHRCPMNKPLVENDQWQLKKLHVVEANIQSYVGMGEQTSQFSANFDSLTPK